MATLTERRASRAAPRMAVNPAWAFVALTFGFTWLVLLPAVLAARGLFALPFPPLVLIAVAQFGPSLAAFVLVGRAEGRPGVTRLARRALDFRFPRRWLLVALLLPIALTGGAFALHAAITGRHPPLTLLAQPVAIVPVFLIILFLQGPVPEEFGWRGYLLDRLQARWSAPVSGLILGMLWGVWHLPLFFIAGSSIAALPLAPYLVSVVAFSVLMTWLYNHTGGSLAPALLFHAAINLSIQLFPPMALERGADAGGYLALAAVYVLAAALVLALQMARTRRNNQTLLNRR